MRTFVSCSAIIVAMLMDLAMSGHVSLAQTPSPAAQRGQTFLRTHCAACHAVGKSGVSPLPIAPPFRNLHLSYPVESLQEALGEGIVTGHPTMPEFRLDPGQIDDVISYLKTLER
jgi:cytochrome c